MFKFRADHLVVLARNLNVLQTFIDTPPPSWNALLGPHPDEDRRPATVKAFLVGLKRACEDADLATSADVINGRIPNPPTDGQGMQIIFDVVISEMKRRLFLRVPDDRAKYWENPDLLSHKVQSEFPSAAWELIEVANAYTCGLWAASVFHSMRAAEVGLRALASDVGVTFKHGDLSLEQWLVLIRNIESKIKPMDQEEKSTERREKQEFYSSAAAQFRYFKDGYRIKVAHTTAPVSQNMSLSILNQTKEFFEVLSLRLRERT